MMMLTHLLMGALLGSVMLFIAPGYAFYAVISGAMGGGFPDLDLVFDHRKTFHFPFYYTVAAVAALVIAVLAPMEATVVPAFFLVGAAAHSLADIFGGDLGERPWLQEDDRGVYYHPRQQWIPPQRWIPYDGSPQDFVLLLVLAVPLLYLHSGRIQLLTLAAIIAGFVYMLVRKKLVDWAPDWVDRIL